jgi:adenine-specific DNA-methyltransferase
MSSRQKLELTWVGKDERPRLEPRILLEDPALSYHAKARVTGTDQFDNRLIFGDNLLALKALEAEFAGRVQLVYIDPPFNTGQAFKHYDDGVEHSIWLSLMRDRLELLRGLLSPTGTIFVHCDDVEQAYLRVMMDEVFGRSCFITTFIWRKVDSPNDNKVPVTPDHDYIICYSRHPGVAMMSQKLAPSLLDAYRNRDESGRLYRDRLLKKNGKNSLRADRPTMFYPIIGPDGAEVYPMHDDGREARWSLGRETVEALQRENALVWKKRGAGWVPYTREFAPEIPTRPWPSIWAELHTTRQAKQHLTALLPGAEQFDTPKPEMLIEQVLTLASRPGDIVLDSFAGSGTTGAVAHKMGRRWIMVELGEHCHTHIIPRLRKVIDGDDPGGVTESTNWKGGGGFRYFRLAPSLLERDRWGNWVISKHYNAAMLAEAVCKIEGFRYAPSAEVFWQHGQSSEQDFIWVTTQELTAQQLDAIATDVGPNRSLLVCCAAWTGDASAFPNLTLKKIPNAVLARCEFGKDDYSLAIAAMPAPESAPDQADDEAEEPPVAEPRRRPVAKRARRSDG